MPAPDSDSSIQKNVTSPELGRKGGYWVGGGVCTEKRITGEISESGDKPMVVATDDVAIRSASSPKPIKLDRSTHQKQGTVQAALRDNG